MLPGDYPHIKLSELSHRIEDVLKQHFSVQFFWVVAEVSGHKFYASNARHYFEFVEKAEGMHEPLAKFRAVAWSAGSESIRKFEEATLQQFTNGIQVLARVKVEYHAVHGLTLVLQEVDQFYTLGNLEKQRLEILHRLVVENADAISKHGDEYITKNKRLQFVQVIQVIAVVGSPNSEGFVDFMHTLDSNQYGYHFTKDIYQSTVQGQFAEAELVQTLVKVYESKKNYDAVIIIRGGGAKTDFLAFDTYRLARTVARFPIPIITGIGHHKDVSITDMMAHTSTKTPTKAAEFIISHNRQFEDAVLELQGQVVIKAQQLLAKQNELLSRHKLILVNNSRLLMHGHLSDLQQRSKNITTAAKALLTSKQFLLQKDEHRLSSAPVLQFSKLRNELQASAERIKTGSKFRLMNQQQNLQQITRVIAVMHPDNVLKKGFAIISQHNKIIADAAAIEEGSDITLTTEKFELTTTVKNKSPR